MRKLAASMPSFVEGFWLACKTTCSTPVRRAIVFFVATSEVVPQGKSMGFGCEREVVILQRWLRS